MDKIIPSISVVVLCYQSEDAIRPLVEELISSLEKCEPNWEIVLVANYMGSSGDKTPKIVSQIASTDKRIKTVCKIKEGMMGWDMRSGLETATGENIAVIDGDGQMPVTDVIRVYEKLKTEDLDLVKPFRAQRDDGYYRLIISLVFNTVFKILFPGLRCRDVNSKPKIMRRNVYEKMKLTSDDWFIDTEIMIQAGKLKLKVGEIPTIFKSNESRPSFVKPAAILEFIGNLLKYRFTDFGHPPEKDRRNQ